MGLSDFHPIQNSEVYILNSSSHIHSHPAPPSPPTPCETRNLSPAPSDGCLTPPPQLDPYPTTLQRLNTAVHVLSTEATALSHLTRLYETDPIARAGFSGAVDAITRCMSRRGKIVICGVGKSGHIAKKLVATMNSLQISSTFLHPTEALHGDLGSVGDADVILLITFSGRTPELLSLLPHFNPALPLMLITSHTHPSTCAIIDARPDTILLPAPIHESETISFGVSAPTTSTTIALALGDALAVTVSDELHPCVAEVFGRNHPGGAIGQTYQGPKKIGDIAVSLDDIPDVKSVGQVVRAVNVIMTGYTSPSGWVRYGNEGVVTPARIRRLQPRDMDLAVEQVQNLVVCRKSSIPVQFDLNIDAAVRWILDAREDGEKSFTDDAVLSVQQDDKCIGLLEVGMLMAANNS